MNKNLKFTMAGALVITLAVVMYVNRSSNHGEVTVNVAPKAEQNSAPVLPNAEGVVNAKKIPAAKELPANPYLTKESMATLPGAMKEFLLLDMKTVKNTEETQEFYEILRSPAALDDAKKILMKVNEQNIAESEREHLTATRFLARAMGDLNNKSNRDLNDLVKSIILTDNISGNKSLQVKMLLAGDKAELAQNYFAFNPHGKSEILAQAKNPNIKRIIENAYVYNETMRIKD